MAPYDHRSPEHVSKHMRPRKQRDAVRDTGLENNAWLMCGSGGDLLDYKWLSCMLGVVNLT